MYLVPDKNQISLPRTTMTDSESHEAQARRVILAAVMRDDDALNSILDEAACCRELALTLGQLAAGMLIARYGRAHAEQFALDDAAYWLDNLRMIEE
jgi:predicted RNA methylase